MATALKPIGHEDRLTIVDHLDELRTRLFVCAITLAIAFAVCFWQNSTLIDVLNKPLKNSTPTVQECKGNGRLAQVACAQREVQSGFAATAKAFEALATAKNLTPAQRGAVAAAAEQAADAARALPRTTPERVPITIGVGEPFTVTLTIAAYFALLFSLPLLLYQLYAFVLPAFSPQERRVALPMMLMVPMLFLVGVAFGYYLVLPPAISFLQNFNNTNFDVLIQAKDYYRFEFLALLSTGLVFQLPVGLLALNAVGIVSAEQLRASWRYAIVAIAVIAAILPGVDPVTTVILMVPLLLLYLLSILLLTIADRRRGNRGELAAFALRDDDGEETEES
jgi:sec-independent protein translocase protein TatC